MKTIKKASYVVFLSFIISSTFQCSSSKYKLQDKAEFQKDRVYFQEWFAGIKVGGKGINIYFPNLNGNKNVVMDSVYFRHLKGKLIEGRAMYSAILKSKSPYDTTTQVVKFPFKLSGNECVVSYTENGETKYFKIGNISEREGIYYEDGPPSVLATVD
jgi:hypothetical protein